MLRHRLSYFECDLVVPTWNAAFVYDTDSGGQAAVEILEFANSQLVEFRYYDELLDRELERIYADLQRPSWFKGWFGRRYTRSAQQVHALFIDVNELTDRAENALKFAGDVYTARLFTLAGVRLGLDRLEGERPRQAQDARRYLSLRRRADGDGARRDARDHDRADPDLRAASCSSWGSCSDAGT